MKLSVSLPLMGKVPRFILLLKNLLPFANDILLAKTSSQVFLQKHDIITPKKVTIWEKVSNMHLANAVANNQLQTCSRTSDNFKVLAWKVVQEKLFQEMFLNTRRLYWKWAHEDTGDKVTDIPVKIVKGELAWSCCFCELPLSHNLLKACYTTSQDTLSSVFTMLLPTKRTQ